MKQSAKQLTRVAIEFLSERKDKELEQAVEGFLAWLRDEREEHHLPEILRMIDQVWKEKFGAANVSVSTATPLSREVRKRLERVVPGATITETVDPELIGGARIRIDDRVIDGSVRGALSSLKEALVQS